VDAKVTSHWPITLTNGAAAVFNIFLPLGLVRLLSPDQVGRYSVFFLYAGLSPGLFFTAGLTNGLYHWAGKYPESRPELRQSWTLLVLITFSICALGLIGARWFAPFIKIPMLDLQLLLLSAPFAIGAQFLEDLLIARGDIWKGSFYGSGFNFFRAASLLITAWWTRRIDTVLWVYFASSVLRALVGCILLFKSGEITFIFSKEKTRNVLRYALPVSMAGASGLAVRNADQMFLSFLLSPASFAYYAMGCLSIPPLEILESSVNRVMIPRLSNAFASKERLRAAAIFSEGVSELFCFLLPATVGLIVYSRPIIEILFTRRYMAAAGYLQFYALIYLFLSIPYDAVARARADGGWILRSYLLFSFLFVPITWIAAAHGGAMGALISLLAGQLLLRVYSLHYNRECFAAPLSQFLPLKPMLIQSGLALVAAAFSLLTRPLFHDPRTWFLITGPLFTVIYFAGVYGVYLRRYAAAGGPIHVLELAQTVGLGGLERIVYSLSEALHQHPRFKVLVATYDHPEDMPSLAAQFQESGIPLIQWQKGEGFSFRSVLRLVRIVMSEKTRIVHVHDLGPLIYGSLVKLLTLGRVRLFVTVHSLVDIQRTDRHRFYYTFFSRFTDRIIAVSPVIRSELISLGIRPERVEVIPNGASFAFFPAHQDKPDEKLALRKQMIPRLPPEFYTDRWVLCLARLQPAKGQDVVLDVWSALPGHVQHELVLFFVGQESQPGYVDSLRARIRKSADSERIIVAGPSAHPQEWLQCADVFISGSLNEGMPLAPLEAAGSGLPTVLTDIEGHRFLKPWAHTFDPANPDEGAQKVMEILATLENDGNPAARENRWAAAESLRTQWGTTRMAATYAEMFLCN